MASRGSKKKPSLRRRSSRRTSLFPARTPSPATTEDETAVPKASSEGLAEPVEDAPGESDSPADPSPVEPPEAAAAELDELAQQSLPAFGDDGKALDVDEFPAPVVDEEKLAQGLTLPSDADKGPTLSVDGAYDIPPESISEFAQLIDAEEEAEEAASRGEAHLSEPPASSVEDYLKDGYFEAVQATVEDGDRPPSSLAAMFEEMGGQDRPWWADDEEAYTGEADELIRASTPPFAPPPEEPAGKKPPVPKKPPVRKKPPIRRRRKSAPPPLPAGGDPPADEAAKALLRASGRQAAPAVDDIDAELADELAATDRDSRPPGRAAAPAESQRSARWPLYAVGLLVAGGVGFFLDRSSRTPAGPAAPPATVVRTVVIDPSGAGPRVDGGSPAESSTSTVTAGPMGGPPAGWPPGVAGWGRVPSAPDTDAGGGPSSVAAPDGGSAEPVASDAPTAEATATPAAAEFDRAAARQALQGAAGAASACPRGADEGSRTATVAVTFAPSGRVTTALLTGGSYAGTQTGSCIARAFKAARVPPFEGSFVTVHKTVRLR